MLDLKRRRQDIRAFVAALEEVIIRTLDSMNVRGERREDRVGVWVRRPERPLLPDGTMAEDKIAALGIRVRKWVTFHGLSLNVDPDLGHFSGIVPCGISAYGVTSLVDLGLPVMMTDVDIRLREAFRAGIRRNRQRGLVRDVLADIAQPDLMVEPFDLPRCRLDQTADFLVGGAKARKFDPDGFQRPFVTILTRPIARAGHQPSR